MKFAVELSNLSKSYLNKENHRMQSALSFVNLTIKKGSIFGLLGPNGAGKSTLINIISGLTLKTSGKVNVLGVDLDNNSNSIKRLIGVAPQEIVIDPFFTVKDTLKLYAGYFGIKKPDSKIKELVDILGLSKNLNSTARSLSGGMRRRLLIAKALIHDPEILLLDEPSAGVDVELRGQLWEYIKDLSFLGKTVILTTHYIEEADNLCDHVAIMGEGRVLLSGKKTSLLNKISQKDLIIKINSANIDNVVSFFEDKEITVYKKSVSELVLRYNTTTVSIDNILKGITSMGVSIEDISTKKITLEDVFKKIIDKK